MGLPQKKSEEFRLFQGSIVFGVVRGSRSGYVSGSNRIPRSAEWQPNRMVE